MDLVINKLHQRFTESLISIFDKLELGTIDHILDDRDNHGFSQSWGNAFMEIGNSTTENKFKDKMDEIRKTIYITTYKKTKSADLSAYISDDFDLIGFHLINGTQNKWVSALLAAYLQSQIPHSELPKADKSLLELIN